MPKKVRIPIPQDLAAKVLFEADRTCCVCRQKKPVQIHHIDEDPSNNAFENLAVLCQDCHRDTQIRGGFDRKLDAGQVRLYRRDWLEQVRNFRVKPLRVANSTGPTPLSVRAMLARLEIAKSNEDWLSVARIYDAAGDLELRDKYVEIALAKDDRPFMQVLLRDMQGRAAELPEAVKVAAAEEVSEDWTTHGGVLLDVGKVQEAAMTWLLGITEAIADGKWFLAAYYIQHALRDQLVEPLFEMALRENIENGDLWWQLRCYEELGWKDSARELLLSNESQISGGVNRLLKQKLALAKGDEDEYLAVLKELETLGPAGYIDSTGEDGDVQTQGSE